jgi:hypothetical protein
MLINISRYTIGNRTRDLPACSTVPQPTAPLRTPANCTAAIEIDSYMFRLQSSHHQSLCIRNIKGNYIHVCIKVIKRPTNALAFMNVILLHSDDRHTFGQPRGHLRAEILSINRS